MRSIGRAKVENEMSQEQKQKNGTAQEKNTKEKLVDTWISERVGSCVQEKRQKFHL